VGSIRSRREKGPVRATQTPPHKEEKHNIKENRGLPPKRPASEKEALQGVQKSFFNQLFQTCFCPTEVLGGRSGGTKKRQGWAASEGDEEKGGTGAEDCGKRGCNSLKRFEKRTGIGITCEERNFDRCLDLTGQKLNEKKRRVTYL